MGTAASEAAVEHCPSVSVHVCPNAAENVILRQQQKTRKLKIMNSTGFQLEMAKRTNNPVLTPNEPDNMLDRFMHAVGFSNQPAKPAISVADVADEYDTERPCRTYERNPDEDLRNAAIRSDLKRIKTALGMKADVCAVNARQLSPLMLAAASSGKENFEAVKMLIAEAADLKGKDANGWTCLHHACRNGKTEIAKYLISLKADAKAKTSDDTTTLMLTAIEGKAELVKELLKDKKTALQIHDKNAFNATALHFTCKAGFQDVVKILLDHSAKVNSKDVDSKTPLMWASEHGKLQCARTLLKKGAELEARDKCHRSALLYACGNSYEAVALHLVKMLADPCQPDVEGDTALSMADDMGLAEFRRVVNLRRKSEEFDD